MSYRIKALVCLLLGLITSFTGLAQVKDTLILKNGQVLIGKLKSISLGKVSFDPDDIDIITIKVNRIQTIKAISHLYRLEMVNRRTIYTSLQSDDSGKVKISVEPGVIPIEQISKLSPLRGKTGALWQGNISAGYSYSRSSGLGQFNSDYTLSYTSRRYGVLANGSVVTTQTDSTFELSNADQSFLGSYLLTPLWEGMVLANYQRNLELGLSRRYQEGLAIGLAFISSVNIRAKALSGVVFNQEKNTEGVETPTQVEVPLIVLFNFYHFRRPDMTLTAKQSLFAGITQAGRFRHDGEINLSVKIITDFSVSLRLYDHYDNRPPGETGAKIDFGVVFGLSYKFSQ